MFRLRLTHKVVRSDCCTVSRVHHDCVNMRLGAECGAVAMALSEADQPFAIPVGLAIVLWNPPHTPRFRYAV